MDFQQSCLGACNPAQILNINMAFNDLNEIDIKGNCNESYSHDSLQYSYSLDNVCWSCYMTYNEFLRNTLDLKSDFYIRVKVSGIITGVYINGEKFTDYTTSIASGFNFTYCTANNTSSNLFNPYINMDCAITLAQQLTETVSCMFGIPIYYFKLSPDVNSKDLTFKEYTLMNVESVKQIKLIIAENQMPSSRPEFTEWGLDFSNDWETEISKGMFATAFGNTAQPMEGDLIYIPMMKRMWMVNEAYEEKKDAFMWNATTFKVMLVKYQEKDSVDLGDTESLVNTFVKHKYEDLFGEDENIGSSEAILDSPNYAANNLKPIFESDATRKYITCDSIEFEASSTYYKGTLISDNFYNFIMGDQKTIIYQKQYCGKNGTISFIVNATRSINSGTLIKIGNLMVTFSQSKTDFKLKVENSDIEITLQPSTTYFVYIRWSEQLNVVELSASKYVHQNVSAFKLQNHHWYFDIDNLETVSSKYNIEMAVTNKSDIVVTSLIGYITNIKVFDIYNDNISEILQMYPTNQHLIVNDTARKIVDLNGVSIR